MKRCSIYWPVACLLVASACLFSGCGGGGGTSGPAIVRHAAWVDGAMTQPVPAWGSPVRLSLPVPISNIAFGTFGIGSFGAHEGGHVEGLDHVWIETDADAQVCSWAAGRVTDVQWSGSEYWITIDYGQGLTGKHMEIETPLVHEGDMVTEGQPVAIGMLSGSCRSAEFYLMDANRSGENTGVSPFDYLKDDVKAAFVQAYQQQVVEPYFSHGQSAGASRPWEPYLTNKVLFHDEHPGTVIGEWMLTSEHWAPGGHPDVLVFIDANNEYYQGRRVEALDNTGDISNPLYGTWDVDEQLKRIVIHGVSNTYYGIYELDESGSRARLKIEYQTGSYPDQFTAGAVEYVERAPLPRTEAAQQAGG